MSVQKLSSYPIETAMQLPLSPEMLDLLGWASRRVAEDEWCTWPCGARAEAEDFAALCFRLLPSILS